MLPPGLLMSSSPIVLPVRLSSRRARVERTRGDSSSGLTSVIGISTSQIADFGLRILIGIRRQPTIRNPQSSHFSFRNKIGHHLAASWAGLPAPYHCRKLASCSSGNHQLDRGRILKLQVTRLAVNRRLLVEPLIGHAFFIVAKRDACVLVQKVAQSLFVEAISVKCPYMFRAKHDHRFHSDADAIRPYSCECAAYCLKNLRTVTRLMLADAMGRLAREERERALIGLEAHLDVQRLPRIRLFVFGYTVRKLPRVPKRGHIDLARPRTAHVCEYQLQGASKRAVRSSDITEYIARGCEAKLTSNRPVDNHHRRSEVRGRLDAVYVEAFVANGSHKRDQHAHHLSLAACHHRVGRYLFDSGRAVVRWDQRDYFFRS